MIKKSILWTVLYLALSFIFVRVLRFYFSAPTDEISTTTDLVSRLINMKLLLNLGYVVCSILLYFSVRKSINPWYIRIFYVILFYVFVRYVLNSVW